MVRNTIVNAGGSVVMVIVGLALAPFLIHRLGPEAYGVWIIATTVSFGFGYLSFTDLGIEQAAVRYIAEARAAHDELEVNRLWLTALAFLTAIALLLTPPLVLLAGPLVDLFSVPEELEREAVVAFALVIGQLVFELPGRAFAALLEGAQRYGLWQLARVAQTVIINGLVVAVVLEGKGIDWLGIATFGGQALSLVVLAALALRGVPGMRISPRLIARPTARKLATFGGQLFALRFLGSIYRQMDKVIIGIALTAAAVTTYEVGNKVYMGAVLVFFVASSTLVPAAAFNRDEPGRLREMLLRGSNYTVALALPFLVAAFIFADPLIRTWIGEAQTTSVTPARLLLLTLVPELFIGVGQTMLIGLGVVRPLIRIWMGWIALNLGLSIALIGPMGVDGVVLATLISTLTVLFIPVLRLVLREVAVGAFEWTREVVIPVLPGVVVQCGVGLLLLPIAKGSSSLLVAAALFSVTIAASLAVWVLVGLSSQRRRDLFQMIRETAGQEQGEPIAEGDLAGDLPASPAASIRE